MLVEQEKKGEVEERDTPGKLQLSQAAGAEMTAAVFPVHFCLQPQEVVKLVLVCKAAVGSVADSGC